MYMIRLWAHVGSKHVQSTVRQSPLAPVCPGSSHTVSYLLALEFDSLWLPFNYPQGKTVPRYQSKSMIFPKALTVPYTIPQTEKTYRAVN